MGRASWCGGPDAVALGWVTSAAAGRRVLIALVYGCFGYSWVHSSARVMPTAFNSSITTWSTARAIIGATASLQSSQTRGAVPPASTAAWLGLYKKSSHLVSLR